MASRAIKTYTLTGAVSENVSDAAAASPQAIGFKRTRNVYPARRLGALTTRRGSSTEAISSGLGIPLGMFEVLLGSSSSLIPVTRQLLVNFAGANFYKHASGSWSSVTKSPHTSFSTTKQNTSAKFAQTAWIAGGRPALWEGGSGSVVRVGISAPTVAVDLASSGTGITGTFAYAYSYYNSSSGLESDLKELGSITVSNKQVDLGGSTAFPSSVTTGEGDWDQKRIYRTIDNGGQYRLLKTISLATTTTTDTTADDALGALFGGAQFGTGKPGSFLPPPTNSYITAAYANKIWWVDADNPYRLVHSQSYTGDLNQLQYYPEENQTFADEPITGLIVTPNRMLVFHPSGISHVTGSSNADLRLQPLFQGMGTLFANTIATDGKRVVFLAEEGVAELSDGPPKIISTDIHESLEPILNAEYNSSLYASISYNPSIAQFLFTISAISSDSSPWVVSGSGVLAGWVDSTTKLPATWQNSASPGSERTTRFANWGYSPGAGQWAPYDFAQIQDLNPDQAYATFLYSPHQSSDTLDPQQDKTYMGVFDGTEGLVIATHKRDAVKDDSTDVTWEFLTDRLLPEPGAESFLFHGITFNSDESDPSRMGTLTYLKNVEDPHKKSYQSLLKSFEDVGDLKIPEEGDCKWIHLRASGISTEAERVVLSDFNLHYRPRMTRSLR